MPPTTPVAPVRSLLLNQQSRRQLIPPEQTVANPEPTAADTKTDTAVGAFTPYSPPSSLHAAILPSISKPSGSGPEPSHHPSTPTGEIIAITVSIVFAGLLCILALILALSRHRSKKLKTVLKRMFAKDPPATMTAGLTPPEDLIIDVRTKEAVQTQNMVVHLDSESEKSNEVEWSIETDISEGPLPPLRVPPSVYSEEYADLGDDVPNVAAFWSRKGLQEADICLATSIPETEPGLEFNSMADSLVTCGSWDIKNRTRQGSDASELTHETTGSNIFSIGATTCSSKTSVRRNDNSQEDMELDDDLNTEETAFEVARARTQSVEMKRGILINWGGELGGTSCGKFGGSMLPSVVVTCPSSLSSISVDLNEFPLPPDDFVYMVET